MLYSPQLECLSGYKTRLVESTGTPLSKLFCLDLSDYRCHGADCPVCEYHTGKGSSHCKRKSVVYQSFCQVYQTAGFQDVCYVGDSGCSLYERSHEHLEDAHRKKDASHIWKHWAVKTLTWSHSPSSRSESSRPTEHRWRGISMKLSKFLQMELLMLSVSSDSTNSRGSQFSLHQGRCRQKRLKLLNLTWR